jgi:hypothetical protein
VSSLSKRKRINEKEINEKEKTNRKTEKGIRHSLELPGPCRQLSMGDRRSAARANLTWGQAIRGMRGPAQLSEASGGAHVMFEIARALVTCEIGYLSLHIEHCS